MEYYPAVPNAFLTNKGTYGQNEIVLREQNEIISEAAKVCTIFNEHFVNIAADIGPDQNNADYTYHPSVVGIKNGNKNINTFAFRPVKPEEVFTKLQKLKLNKATGCDKMPGIFLKIVSLNIATPLASLINASIRQCQFPHDLKLTNVSPVFKKKENLDKVNYRPVSILPALSKIYEGLLAEQMTCHFQGIFDIYLSAFRKTYGCQPILLKLV